MVPLPSDRSARSRIFPGRVSERRTLPLLGLGRVYFRRTQKAFGTAMRLCASLFRRRRGPAGLRDFFVSVEIAACTPCAQGFSACARRGWYRPPGRRPAAPRPRFSACARRGWYHYPRCAPRAAETLDGRLSKRLFYRFLRSVGAVPRTMSIFLRIYRIFCQQLQLQMLLCYGTQIRIAGGKNE